MPETMWSRSWAELPGRGAWRVALLIVAYVLVAVVMTWPYVNHSDFGGSTYGGDHRLIVWTLAWDNHAVLTQDTLFASNLFYPAPDSLRYNEHLFGVSLFTLPWAVAGASPVLAHNATWFLAFPLNGLMAFLLIRRFAGSALAAFVGSLAFTYSFYVMSHAHGHLHLIWLWPIPLSLWLLERWFDRPSVYRVGLWSAVVLLEVLSSWYLAVLVLIANGLLGVVLLVSVWPWRVFAASGDREPWLRRAAHLTGAAAVLSLCVFPFARQYLHLTSSEGMVAANSADTSSYVVPPENTLIGRWWLQHGNDLPREIWGEQTLFAGWLALAMAAIGLLVLFRRPKANPRAWFFPLLTVVTAALSYGSSLSVSGAAWLAPFNWLAAVPGLDGFRAPARFAALVMLGLSGLVGLGAAAVIRRHGTKGRVLLVLLVPVMLLEWFVVDFPGGKPESYRIPAIYETPEVRTARSLVSLPDYQDMPDWFRGGDYLYYSTAHWRPIVNGFGRTAPADHDEVLRVVRAFPESIPEMRGLGIQYVVLHADRFADGAREIVKAAAGRSDCHLVRRIGADYLFELSSS